MAEIATHRRTDRRRERRDEADNRRNDWALGWREDDEGRSKHRRDHAATDKALEGAVDDHLVDIGGGRGKCARRGEAGRRDREHDPGRKNPRGHARKWDHDDFSNQIGRLHPGSLIRAGTEARLNFRQGCRDDLDVQNSHEHAENHREERKDTASRDWRFRRYACLHVLRDIVGHGHSLNRSNPGNNASRLYVRDSVKQKDGRFARLVSSAQTFSMPLLRRRCLGGDGVVRVSTSTTTDKPAIRRGFQAHPWGLRCEPVAAG